MEREALAVWDKTRSQHKDREVPESPKEEVSDMSPGKHQSSEPRTDSERGEATGFFHFLAVDELKEIRRNTSYGLENINK